MIEVNKYPALEQLLWDAKSPSMSEEDAFCYYQSRWDFVCESELSEQEKHLISDLSSIYGDLPPR